MFPMQIVCVIILWTMASPLLHGPLVCTQEKQSSCGVAPLHKELWDHEKAQALASQVLHVSRISYLPSSLLASCFSFTTVSAYDAQWNFEEIVQMRCV